MNDRNSATAEEQAAVTAEVSRNVSNITRHYVQNDKIHYTPLANRGAIGRVSSQTIR